MKDQTSSELSALLSAQDPPSREQAWADFLESHSDLLLRVAGRFGGGYDARMDRYHYVIESLSRNGFERLRTYSPQARSSFRSWLVVVARRLCIDHERSRYGRGGRAADVEAARHDRTVRRRLVDLVGSEIDLARLASPASGNPERRLREEELLAALFDALETLDPRDALLLALRFEDGAAVSEITRIMDFPSVFHVYHRLRAVLDGLRERLVSRGFLDPVP
ncbi:MAG TPA: sigma-70 family RNA polymerase sigma factor [Longimicrobiaceae bacterium]|nr:sigma-70 family RNA polymerase sigma factor [Longimicrobiaceae bacterium]